MSVASADRTRLSAHTGVAVNFRGSIEELSASPTEVMGDIAKYDVAVYGPLERSPTAAEFSEFGSSLGEVFLPPYLETVHGAPGVSRVTRRPSDSGLSFYAGAWHADWTFTPEPPRIAALAALEVPADRFTGATYFSNQAAAFEWLSLDFQRMLAELESEHSSLLSYTRDNGAYAADPIVRSMRIDVDESAKAAVHPVVMVDPISARSHLFVNPAYTRRISKWTIDESLPLLQYLFRWSTYEEFSARINWMEGMVAVWNNRTLLHRVANDHDAAQRTLLRINLR